MSKDWKTSVDEALENHEELWGDDCRKSRSWLLGTAATMFQVNLGRRPTEEEELLMLGEIHKFLLTDTTKAIYMLDKVLRVFVDADQDLETSTCECCKEKRELLKELRENFLVK